MTSIFNFLSDFQAAAEKLGNPGVVVRLRKPPIRYARGEFYKLENGVLVMDIDPDLDLDQALKTFLHEVAHSKYHVGVISVTTKAETVSGSLNDYDYAPLEVEESQAEAQAREWLEWVNVEAEKHLKPTDPEGKKLKIKLALLHFYT